MHLYHMVAKLLKIYETHRLWDILLMNDRQRGIFDSVSYFPMLSNPVGTQKVSCLRIRGWDICPKSYSGLGTFNPRLSVSIW